MKAKDIAQQEKESVSKHLEPKKLPNVAPQCHFYMHKEVLCLQTELPRIV